MTTEQEVSAPTRRKWLVPAIVGAVVVIAAAVTVPLMVGASQPGFTATGTLMINGVRGYTASGATCAGTGGFDDIAAGTDVNVYDDSGKLVANSKLEAGVPRQGACVFSFTVPSIPSGGKLYQIEVSHRGKLTESEQQLTSGVALTLG